MFLTHLNGCAGNYTFAGQAFVTERRSDGAVRVSLLVWTWDGRCGPSGRTSGWAQRYQWIEPGETQTIEVAFGSRGGSVRATATFTNNWRLASVGPIGVELDNAVRDDDADKDAPQIEIGNPEFLEKPQPVLPLPGLTKPTKIPGF